LGVQISILFPRTDPPVSATVYSPLYAPAFSRTRVPSGSTLGSAAINPLLTRMPFAVRPPRLYAVAVYVASPLPGFSLESDGPVSVPRESVATVTIPIGVTVFAAVAAFARLASTLTAGVATVEVTELAMGVFESSFESGLLVWLTSCLERWKDERRVSPAEDLAERKKELEKSVAAITVLPPKRDFICSGLRPKLGVSLSAATTRESGSVPKLDLQL